MRYKGDRKERPVIIPKKQKSLITEISTKPSRKMMDEVNEVPTKNGKTLAQPKYTITEELKDNKLYLIISIEIPSMVSD